MSENAVALRPAKAGEIMESLIARGDLGQLRPDERAKYYTRVCESMGLNPLTKPFDYITLNGKLTLYALKTATDQLRKIHGVSVVDMTEKRDGDLMVVTVKVQDKDGRTDMAKGALPLSGLKGDALANAIMKCETKAKRRATLSICGLGFLDETEVETIPQARVLKKDHRAEYHKMQEELDGFTSALAMHEWWKENVNRIAALPADWRQSLSTIIEVKCQEIDAGREPPSSGDILSDEWGRRQGDALRTATQAHHADEPTELWADPEDTPPEWSDKWEALGPVKQAGILCGTEAFQKFLAVANTDNAAQIVRDRCQVKSRAELATDEKAAKLWRALVAEYCTWQCTPDLDPPHPTQGTSDAAAAAPAHTPHQSQPAGAADLSVVDADKMLGEAATRGMAALQEAWSTLPKATQKALKAALDRRHKPVAESFG